MEWNWVVNTDQLICEIAEKSHHALDLTLDNQITDPFD